MEKSNSNNYAWQQGHILAYKGGWGSKVTWAWTLDSNLRNTELSLKQQRQQQLVGLGAQMREGNNSIYTCVRKNAVVMIYVQDAGRSITEHGIKLNKT